MELTEYFEKADGHGVLATADSSGKVDVALYARPHFIDSNTVAFIMADRLTHENLQSNPHAAYLFIKSGTGFQGKRLFLTKSYEEENEDLVNEICRRCDYSIHRNSMTRYVVSFSVDKELPLIGSG